MRELSEYEFPEVLPLYEKAKIDFPLIRAVIRKKQTGKVWVDKKKDPSNAFVWTKFGFTYLFCDENDESFNSEIEALIFKDSSFECKYLLWYNPPKLWCDKMDLMPDEIARRRIRIQFKFNKQVYNEFINQKNILPSNFFIKKIDSKLIEKIAVFNLDINKRFWASANDFLKNGFGFCVLKNDEPVSICYSACIVNRVAEIDVFTLEKYRGLGLATFAVSAFIKYGIENNIIPNWDCFDYNKPSISLAKRLGFSESLKYPFYSINRE
jgi:RimJ/RimL family protein N-acetyltransferase